MPCSSAGPHSTTSPAGYGQPPGGAGSVDSSGSCRGPAPVPGRRLSGWPSICSAGSRIGGWVANESIYDDTGGLIGLGDLVFRAERVVIELDGRAFHSTSERFERDRYRQNRLISAGWTVLRFTWRDLTRRPDYVIATVRRVVGGRRGRDRA